MSVNDALTRDDARARARMLGEVSYDVSLDLTAGPEVFGSRTTLRFRCAEPGASTFVDLNATSVEHATLNGRELPGEAFSGERLALDGLRADNELVVDARCAYTRAGVGLHRFTDPVDERVYLYTQFEPFDAHRVFACFDQPDLKGTFALAVRAPRDWVVVSNGRVARREGPLWRFEPTPPISTYIAALVAGPYHHVHDRHGDIDLGVYCRQSLAEYLDPGEILEITRQGFDFFTELFAYPYPFGKYDQLFVPECNFGAMENAGCVTFTERCVFRSRVTDAARLQRANTILHEMAHMWFGNLVTMRWWDDLWLNESFATYMASLALAEATRFTQSWAEFAQQLKAWAYREDQRPTTHPIVADVTDTDVLHTHFDGITYAKGASVLKQLAHWVGRDAFRDGLRGYFRQHELSNAELGDFLAALEGASGRDLRVWSGQWLETAGLAALRPEFTVDEQGRYASFALVQEAPAEWPTLRDHRLAIGLYESSNGGLARRHRVELDVRGARTEVPDLVGEPVPALLLVNDDDLAYVKIRFDERSIGTLTERLGRISSPLARALCWGAVWDMTRDARLPARQFARLVAVHAEAEDDVGVLQTLLRQAHAAIQLYGDPAHRPHASALLAETAQGALDRAKPGSDEQLLWARCLVTTSADTGFAEGLLDGGVTVEGLAVDADLRWFIVEHLASVGAIGEDAIAAELERDPTDIGIRGSWTARASLPHAEAKARGWEAALSGEADGVPLPLATQRAILSGFWQTGQEELLAEYAEQRWVAALDRIWAQRGIDEALDLTGGVYPATQVADAVVAAADRALAADDVLPPAGRRVVTEGRDDTLRALRARAADAADAAAD
ncbi:MAG: aminopeptidase N [Egibacteraceae bacterium]